MKKSIKRLGLALLLGISSVASAQITWYFGTGGGLKFTGSGTVPAPSSPISTSEGSALLVDNQNNVVMYSDGSQVWNGNHQLQAIPQLAGHSSSTQTALIVPVPGSLGTQAFIFTVTAAENSYGYYDALKAGLRVSLATIGGTAPNSTISIAAGNLNQRLTPAPGLMSERLALTEDGAGGYWILTHGVGFYGNTPPTSPNENTDESNFYAYHVKCGTTTIAALKLTQCKSIITGLTPHYSYNATDNNVVTTQTSGGGQLKFSKDGLKIACPLPAYGNQNWVVTPRCQLYNFNKQTGEVYNGVEVDLNYNTSGGGLKDGTAYGVEFSPNGNYLYTTSCFAGGDMGATTPRLYQYNVQSWNATTITNSKQLIKALGVNTNTNSNGFMAMQTGPDGKIYLARANQNTIDVINNPDNFSAACNYATGISISGICIAGLPTTVLISNNPAVPTISSVTCSGAVSISTGYTGNAPESYSWQIYGCDVNGNPINPAGSQVSSASQSFYYDSNYRLGGPNFITGTPPAVLPTHLNSLAVCGKYYKITVALKSECGSIIKSVSSVIQVKCHNPAIPSIVSSVCKESIAFNTSYTGGTPESYSWQIYGCDANGTPIDNFGSPTSPASAAFFYESNYMNGGTNFVAGVPPTVLPLVYLSGAAICGAYYKVTLVLKSDCGTETKTASSVIQIKCNNPSFNLSDDNSNAVFFTLKATPIDLNAVNNPGFGYWWVLEDLDASGNALFTVYNPQPWWYNTSGAAVNSFKAFDQTANNYVGNVTLSGTLPADGKFLYGHQYRITRGTHDNACPSKQVSVNISPTHVTRNGSSTHELIFTEDKNAPDFSYLVNQVTTGVEVIKSTTDLFSVYPNPSNGIFTIELSNEDKATMEIIDITGKVIKTVQLTKNDHYTLDLSGYSRGIYLIKMNGSQQQLQKIILE